MESLNSFDKKERPGGRIVSKNENSERSENKHWRELTHGAEVFKSENSEFVEIVEGWLQDINSQELQSVFSECAGRSGVAPEDFNFPSLSEIFILEGEEGGIVMSYNPALNSVQIYGRSLAAATKSLGLDERHGYFLHCLFHEYTHATGRVESRVEIDHEQRSATAISNTGLEQSKIVIKDSPSGSPRLERIETTLFELFNEGVTERIADEVLFEYIRRCPIPGGLSATKKVVEAGTSGPYTYYAAKRFTMALTNAIARESGIPEDIVWRAFIRQYYRGDSLLEPEMTTLLNATIGQAFTEALARATEDGLGVLADEHSLNLSKEAAQQWLTELEVRRIS